MESKEKTAPDEDGCFLTLAIVGAIVIGSVNLYNWLVSINPALLTIPLAIGGYSGLFIYDSFKREKEKEETERGVKAEQAAMAKILQDELNLRLEENDDWRDPHW